MKYRGFTLIELLIAAVLVAVLTLFATQTFRRITADIKAENAKRIAEAIAGAAYRFKIEYPNVTFSTDPITTNPGAPTECHPRPVDGAKLQTLVDCNFLESGRNYITEGFSMHFTSTGAVEVSGGSGSGESYVVTGYSPARYMVNMGKL